MNWYDWHAVTERLEGRSQALTRGLPYKITLDTNIQTAACDITGRHIRLNPLAFDDKIKTADTKLRARTNYLVTRALLGHEVLHALYSNPNALPSDDIQRAVTNILEDARIEGIGMAESMVNRHLFKFLSTICRQDQAPFNDYDLIDKMSWMKILFLWRFGGILPVLTSSSNKKKMTGVIGLADDALYAKDSMEVARIAKDICKLTGMTRTAAKKSDRSFPEELDDLKESLSGAGEPKSNPRHRPYVESDESRETNESTNDNAGKQSQQAPSPANDSGSDSQDLSSVGAGEDLQEEGAGESLERLVNDLQAGICDGLDKATDLEDPEMTRVIEAKLAFENDVFDIRPSPYIDLLTEAKPLVQQIVKELKLPAPRSSVAPDKYTGRFKVRYFVRNPEAPFARKKNTGIDVPPMALSLILDRSGSMINMISGMKIAAIGITRACEELGIPLDIRVLEGSAHIKPFDETGPQVYARIAGIRAVGGTDMIPTLLAAQESLAKRPEPLKQMLLIHDGVPDRFEATKELLSSAPFRGLYAMYVIPALKDPELLQKYTEHGRECLSRLFEPRQFSVAPIDRILNEWANFMKLYRSRYSVSIR